jgi:ParB family chromosome partitioning protein
MAMRLKELPLTQLHAHPNNVRTKVDDVAELADSIKAQGIIEPLIVAPHPEVKDEFTVIAGHRRLAAARSARISTAPCIINTGLKTEAQQVEAMLVENLQRVDISPVEEARAYQYLIDLDGYDVARLAKSTGRSQRTVKERLKLGKLSEGQAESLHDGALTLERALVLVEFQDDPTAVNQLECIPARDHSTWQVQVKRLQKERDWKAGLPKLRKELEAGGITLIEPPEGPYYQWSEFVPCTYSDPTTAEEALEQGYDHAIVDAETQHPYGGTAKIIWARKRKAHVAFVPPEPTAEELAERQRRHDIDAALALAAEVREAHVLEQLKASSHAMARKALEALIVQDVPVRRVAWATGMTWSECLDEQEVFDRLPRLQLEQLALLLHFNQVEAEGSLRILNSWDRRSYWYEEQTGPWLAALQEIYGYRLSDPEKEALEYFPTPALEPDDENAEGEDADAA